MSQAEMEMHPEEEAPAAPSETRQRASAANAALARFAAQQQQGVMPTPAELAEQKRLAEARDKIVKALVSEIMDYDRNAPALASSCVQTLLLILGNVVTDPGDDKKRSVKATSNVFSKRVAAVHGAEDFLRAAGWRKRTTNFVASWCFEHEPGTSHWKVLEIALRELQKAEGEVEEKERRATAAAASTAAKKKALDKDREILKQQLKADQEERKDKYVYQ